MENVILGKLLDKYEKSKQANGTARVRRKVNLKINEFSEYYGHNMEYRKSLQQAALNLEKLELVRIDWVPFEKNNLIQALQLNFDQVEEAYRMLGQKPRLDVLGDLEKRLVGLNLTLPWARDFVQDCVKELGAKLQYPTRLPRESQKLELLLSTLQGIQSKGQEEMLERVFSKRFLGNSKVFEQQVRRRLAGILRVYGGSEELEEGDLLTEVGLVRASSEIFVYGPLSIRLKDKLAEIAPFTYGVGFGTETLEAMEIVECKCNRVISVENKATFRELVRAGMPDTTLLLCLGGFCGPVKRRFLKKMHSFLNETVDYYHWGDIDYGGIQIFHHLRQTCLPGLQPLLMDIATYQSYASLGEEFDEGYRGKLQNLLSKEEFTGFHEVLLAMLRQGYTLEQEAVPVESISTDRGFWDY